MYLTVKQQLKHLSKEEYEILKELCHIAKNLTNEAIYNIRQYYFTEGKYLSYSKNNELLKKSPNYKTLNSNMSQQILMEVNGMFSSFSALLKLSKQGKYDIKKCKLPYYLPKDGYTTLVIGFVRLNGNKLVLPYSRSYMNTHNPVTITIPPILMDKTVKEIRIVPKSNARFFEVQYIYKAETIQRELNNNTALAIDLGVNNLVTAVTNRGSSFIIDGRKLKSINQWYNKENARLQSVKDKQGDQKRTTKHQDAISAKRERKVNDYMSKTAKMIIDYCVVNDIGILVFGYNKDFQYKPKMKNYTKQNFVNIPYGKLKDKLMYLCELNDIVFVEQEESYTSQASFWDKDPIPVYDSDNPQSYSFSGNRIKRGLYRTAAGKMINADVNGALNILRKSNVVDLTVLYSSGAVDTPVRIRVA